MARRVALVTSSYHPYHGGVESHVRHVARELVALGHEVEVWTVDRGDNLGTQTVDGIAVRNLPTPLPARSVGSLRRFALAGPRAWRAWRRAARSFRPDVLHVQCYGPNGIYGAALARRARLPLVVSSHGETFADAHGAFDESALLRHGLRISMAWAAAVTGCSHLVTEDLKRRFGAKAAVVVPNGVDRSAAQGRAGHRERSLVLGVGRLEHNKGFDLLVDAAAGLPPDISVAIAGDGTQRTPLELQIGRAGLSGRVRLLGALEPEDVADWMSRATVVVVPSRVEAFGIVVLEAWQAGAPVVGTALGGPADLITDGVDGLVVDPRDTEALASAVKEVLADPAAAARLAAAGASTVLGYTWRSVAEAYETIYEATSARRKRGRGAALSASRVPRVPYGP
ncbi:glycosyltransferase family 1 protein [Intrasporangium mesophilum]